MFFSVMTKNLNWETKNIVSYFQKMGWGSGGGRGESPKKGTWIICKFKRRLGGYVFEMWEVAGVEVPMHTMSWRRLLIDTNIQSKLHCNTVLLLILLTIIDTQFLKNLKKKNKCRITNRKNPNQQIGKSLKLWSEKVMQGQQYV